MEHLELTAIEIEQEFAAFFRDVYKFIVPTAIKEEQDMDYLLAISG